MHLYKLKCKTCKKMKHDTAFHFTTERFLFWKVWGDKLDTSKCLDCLDPNRWDEVREGIKEKFNIK